MKRIIALLLALIVSGAFSVFAFGHEVPDPNRKGSVTVTVIYNEEPVSGGSLTLYKVGDVISENGNYGFVFTEDFSECEIPVTELNSAELPAALAKIAREKRLDGTTERINSEGKAFFHGLEIGLYLAVQNQRAPGFGEISPFLVSVPFYENDRYIYDVDASPKVDVERKPEPPKEPEDPDEPDDKLPDTGLMSWPVPVLAVSGTILILAGVVLRRSERKMK